MGGWPPGPFKDTWAVFETERGLRDSFPIRQVGSAQASIADVHEHGADSGDETDRRIFH